VSSRRSGSRLLGVLVAGLFAVAACGSSGGDSASTASDAGGQAASTTAAASATTEAAAASSSAAPSDSAASGATDRCQGTPASGEPIKFGIITTITSPVANSQDMVDGVKAGIDCVNAGGGLNGRPMELSVCDDKGDAATAKTCAQTFVDDKVVAVLSGYSIAGAAEIQPVLEAAGIPRIGHQPLGAADYQSPMSFPLAGGGAAYAPAVAKYIRDNTEVTKIAYAAPNLDVGKATADLFDQLVKSGNRNIEVKRVTFDTTAQDFGPVVTAMTAGFQPDAIVYGAGSGQAAPFLKALQAAGLQDVDTYLSCGASNPNVLAAAGDAATGRIYSCDTYNANVKEFQDRPETGVDTFRTIMETYAPKSVVSALAQFGVASALFVHDVAGELGGADLTSQALVDKIKTLKDFPVVGFYPYTWAPGTGSQAKFPQVPNTNQTLARYPGGDGNWDLVSDMINGVS
jgi:branched-chain amino acid transport system substrate-binding protein